LIEFFFLYLKLILCLLLNIFGEVRIVFRKVLKSNSLIILRLKVFVISDGIIISKLTIRATREALNGSQVTECIGAVFGIFLLLSVVRGSLIPAISLHYPAFRELSIGVGLVNYTRTAVRRLFSLCLF